MIIDRVSDGYVALLDKDSDVMTSPVNLWSFYGNSSPPTEPSVCAGYQSPWSPNSDSETSWSNEGSPVHTGNQPTSVNAESSAGSAGQASQYQGVRVKNTVKDLIMQKRLGNENTQVQQQPFETEYPALTSLLQGQKRIAESTSPAHSHPKRPATAHNNVLSPYHQSESAVTEDVRYPDIYINNLVQNMGVRAPLSIESVKVQGSPLQFAFSPQNHEPLPSLYANATESLHTSCPLPQVTKSSYSPPFQPLAPQPSPGARVGAAPSVSFFHWQIQQEEEKLACLTPAELTSWDGDGDTFLHIAVAQGRRALAYVLAKKMADIGMLDVKEHNSQSALQVSVAANQHLIVQDLMALGAQVNTADCWGRSPLHVCAEKGHSLTLQAIQSALQSSGQQLNVETVNYEGLTPLHTAVLCHNAVVQELGRMGTPQSSQTVALGQRRKLLGDCIGTLLLMGASCGSKDRKSGRTALHMAAEEANVELLRLFLDQPDSLSVINVKAYSGNAALHLASALQGRVAQVDAVKLLMRRGADPSSKNLENEQPAQLVPEGPVGDQVRRILKGRGVQARSDPL